MCAVAFPPTFREHLHAAPSDDGRGGNTMTSGSWTLKGSTALAVLVGCLLAAPTIASAGFVPPPLLNQAAANPGATLNVIVLGQPGTPSATLMTHVKNAGAKNVVPFSVI